MEGPAHTGCPAAALAWALLGQRLTPPQLVAAVLTVAGIALVRYGTAG